MTVQSVTNSDRAGAMEACLCFLFKIPKMPSAFVPNKLLNECHLTVGMHKSNSVIAGTVRQLPKKVFLLLQREAHKDSPSYEIETFLKPLERDIHTMDVFDCRLLLVTQR